MGSVKDRYEERNADYGDKRTNQKGFNRETGPEGACPPGECKIAFDHKTLQRRCRRCGYSVQTLTSGERHPLPGDWRVICRGPKYLDTGACPIGPSRAIPEALKQAAFDEYNDHQCAAEDMLFWCPDCELHIPGGPHDCEIIQFPIE